MNFQLPQVVSCAALGAALVASLSAQGVVGPTRLGPSFQPAGLNPPGVPANSVRQVQLRADLRRARAQSDRRRTKLQSASGGVLRASGGPRSTAAEAFTAKEAATGQFPDRDR